MAESRDAALSRTLDDLSGTTVNRYLVQARLGAGGMGEVYRAEDPTLRRTVAIKRMLRRDATDAERAHFLREGQRASSLNHPNIAHIYDVLLEAGEVLLVMEFIPGETLRARLSQATGPMPPAEFYPIAIQCADALAAAHAKSILHGDVKPENVMLDGAQLKLLDFGVARALDRNAGAATATETALTFGAGMAGTPRYMAPELFAGHLPDERADIFALGVVMYEMLSGRHPFAAVTGVATVGQILYHNPASLAGHPGGTRTHVHRDAVRITPRLAGVVDKALAKDPDKRYPNAKALGDDLRALQAGRRATASPAPRGRPVAGIWRTASIVLLALMALGLVSLGLPPVRRLLAGGSRRASDKEVLLAPHRNLAVLAPSVAGSDPGLAAFGQGLAESVAAKLSELGANHDLAVVSPEELRSKNATTLELARQEFGSTIGLRVSIQTVNDKTRTAYSLIDAASGHILAGSNITARSADLFTLEDEVAGGVARALQLTLRPEEATALATNGTIQPEAYRYYLEGLGYLHDSLNPEETTKAEALFKEALKLDPQYGAAQAGLGEAYWKRYTATRQARWIDEARSACQSAVISGNAGAQGHICLGTLDNGTGSYTEAARQFDEARQLEPSNDAAAMGLAKAYENLSEPLKAEEIYQGVTRMRPQYWRGFNTLGAFYINQAQYDKAAQMFAQAETLAPDNYSVPNNLGGSLLYLGKDQQAAQAFQRSIAIRPTYFAYQNVGVAYFHLRRFTDAAASFRRAIQLNASEYESWGGLGDALYYGSDRNGAMQAYRKAIALGEEQLKVNPRDAEVLGDMGSYYSMLGDSAQATALVDRSIQIGHEDKALLFNAALVYNQLHQEKAALDWLAKAIRAGYSRPVVAGAVALDNLHTDPRYIEMMRPPAGRG